MRGPITALLWERWRRLRFLMLVGPVFLLVAYFYLKEIGKAIESRVSHPILGIPISLLGLMELIFFLGIIGICLLVSTDHDNSAQKRKFLLPVSDKTIALSELTYAFMYTLLISSAYAIFVSPPLGFWQILPSPFPKSFLVVLVSGFVLLSVHSATAILEFRAGCLGVVCGTVIAAFSSFMGVIWLAGKLEDHFFLATFAYSALCLALLYCISLKSVRFADKGPGIAGNATLNVLSWVLTPKIRPPQSKRKTLQSSPGLLPITNKLARLVSYVVLGICVAVFLFYRPSITEFRTVPFDLLQSLTEIWTVIWMPILLGAVFELMSGNTFYYIRPVNVEDVVWHYLRTVLINILLVILAIGACILLGVVYPSIDTTEPAHGIYQGEWPSLAMTIIAAFSTISLMGGAEKRYSLILLCVSPWPLVWMNLLVRLDDERAIQNAVVSPFLIIVAILVIWHICSSENFSNRFRRLLPALWLGCIGIFFAVFESQYGSAYRGYVEITVVLFWASLVIVPVSLLAATFHQMRHTP
jgi:hypothetical protein